MEAFIDNFNYWIYIILMMIGLFAMIAKKNLIKKLVGMTIFQTAIILFYVSIGVKQGASIPILAEELVHPPHHEEPQSETGRHTADDAHSTHHLPEINAQDYANPIPHVLMLTAIVVGVSTLGLALAIVQRVHFHYHSVEEDEILKQIQSGK